MFKLFKALGDWYVGALETYGYPLIALLMAVESSIVPLPSEIVIPPAAHLVHSAQLAQTTPRFSYWGIVVAGTVGSWLGAAAMYWASRWGGRPLVMKYGKYVFISPEKVAGAERWAAHYGAMGIFVARLLPVVRHLIGIPAGIVRMNFLRYSIYTVLGSAIWSAVLCYIGVKVGQDQALMKGEMHRVTLWLGGAVLVLGGLYYAFVHRHMKGGVAGGAGDGTSK
jgi:membrane protein DedA with SNARE-associated domain